jgi:methionyl-tRNA formyltransferase
MRILFLCNNFHPLSVACLQALHAAGRFEITVGLAQQSHPSIRSFAFQLYRRYGVAEALRRGQRFAWAKARIKSRKLGLPFAGYDTIQEYLQDHALDQLHFQKINSPQMVNAIRDRGFDLFVAAAFSQILGPELLAIPRLGALNVHLSLLPQYRGPSPCYWVLKNQERTTGVTVHYMDLGIDSGDIVLQREVPVQSGESPLNLDRRLASIGADLLLEALTQIEAGTARRIPQRHEDAAYFSFPSTQ